jgi:type I site-specific restriction-modification system R (restriction) subunit
MREALPNASWIGFTGTFIEKADANTRAVFGDLASHAQQVSRPSYSRASRVVVISVYDPATAGRAVEDKATVPIYYEGRLAKLELKENEKPKIDPDFEEATEGEELSKKEYLKTKWAALEKIVGADKRLKLIAEDLVKHWEARGEMSNDEFRVSNPGAFHIRQSAFGNLNSPWPSYLRGVARSDPAVEFRQKTCGLRDNRLSSDPPCHDCFSNGLMTR